MLLTKDIIHEIFFPFPERKDCSEFNCKKYVEKNSTLSIINRYNISSILNRYNISVVSLSEKSL